eukprot:5730152-Pyramimonas_sp.AAC.1
MRWPLTGPWSTRGMRAKSDEEVEEGRMGGNEFEGRGSPGRGTEGEELERGKANFEGAIRRVAVTEHPGIDAL